MSKAKEAAPKPMPSSCGSHQSMVDSALTEAHDVQGEVVCVDEHGEENAYITAADRLDDGLADVKRHGRIIKEKGEKS